MKVIMSRILGASYKVDFVGRALAASSLNVNILFENKLCYFCDYMTHLNLDGK